MANFLAPNSTAKELAVDGVASARLQRTMVAGASDVIEPLKTLSEVIPFLAWERHTDIWRSQWPERLRRVVADNAFRDHAIKGSLALHARYLSYAGARLHRANTPHDHIAAGRTRTPAEMDAYLAHLPEIRLYPFAPARQAGKRLFFGRFLDVDHYLSPEEGALSARDRHETRAVLRRSGVETPLRVVEMDVDGDLAEWAMVPRRYKNGFILGRGHVSRQSQLCANKAHRFIAGFRRTPSSAPRVVSGSGSSRPLNPVLVHESHATSAVKAFGNKRRAPRVFLSATVALHHVFDRVRLFEPGLLRSSQRKSFYSHSWARRQTHTMILAVEVRKPMQRRQVMLGGFLSGYARPHDGRHLADAVAAVRAASLPHETILVDLETAYRRRFFGD